MKSILKLCILIFCVSKIDIVQADPDPDPTFNWDGKEWAFHCKFDVGRDLKQEKIEGAKCGPLCKNTLTCTHFNWVKGVCFLKNYPSLRPETDVREYRNQEDKWAVCGFLPERLGKTREDNGDGSKVSCDDDSATILKYEKAVNSVQKCEKACEKTQGCTHFVWKEREEGGTCVMKGGSFTNTQKQPTWIEDHQVFCGFLNQEQQCIPSCLNCTSFENRGGPFCCSGTCLVPAGKRVGVCEEHIVADRHCHLHGNDKEGEGGQGHDEGHGHLSAGQRNSLNSIVLVVSFTVYGLFFN